MMAQTATATTITTKMKHNDNGDDDNRRLHSLLMTTTPTAAVAKKTGTDDETELKHGVAVHDYVQQPLAYLCVHTLNMHIARKKGDNESHTMFIGAHCLIHCMSAFCLTFRVYIWFIFCFFIKKVACIVAVVVVVVRRRQITQIKNKKIKSH